MSDPPTGTLASKGQVVIPEEIRECLRLKAGAQFVVPGDKDVVTVKILQPPAKRDFTASAPLQYNFTSKRGCGVLRLWTRRQILNP